MEAVKHQVGARILQENNLALHHSVDCSSSEQESGATNNCNRIHDADFKLLPPPSSSTAPLADGFHIDVRPSRDDDPCTSLTETGNLGNEPGAEKLEKTADDQLPDSDKNSSQMQQAIALFDNRITPASSLGWPWSAIDPFKNKTPSIDGLYEWVKTVLLLPLLLLRVLGFLLLVSLTIVYSKATMAGWKQSTKPLPQWRRSLMLIPRMCGRALLFCFGYHWITRKGRAAAREVAPIVVSNHVSFLDPIFFFYELFPSIVSSQSHDRLPIVGAIIRSMQVIVVDRLSADSRKQAAIEIKRKAACNDYPLVLLFPEATTTNGRALIHFKLGAFTPGLPIQPVVIRYPFVHFDNSWYGQKCTIVSNPDFHNDVTSQTLDPKP
jgi:1-acyl-sn-glycerol-3-phosphate acyltransferase